jgi:hypothetical protein
MDTLIKPHWDKLFTGLNDGNEPSLEAKREFGSALADEFAIALRPRSKPRRVDDMTSTASTTSTTRQLQRPRRDDIQARIAIDEGGRAGVGAVKQNSGWRAHRVPGQQTVRPLRQFGLPRCRSATNRAST